PWEKITNTSKWLKDESDLPDVTDLLEHVDTKGDVWIMLAPDFHWEEDSTPEEEQLNKPRRHLNYRINSYLVRQHNTKKVFDWASKQWFLGDWMPRAHEIYHVYLGEYPSYPAFLFHYIPYYHHDDWTDYSANEIIPAKILVTDDLYVSSGSNRDSSTERNINVNLPAKYLVDNMQLVQH